MIRIQDNELISYFNSLKEGDVIDKDIVAKHQGLFNVDFSGVTSADDFSQFRITSNGSVTPKAGIVQQRVSVVPTFNNGQGTNPAALKFRYGVEDTVLARAKSIIQMELIKSNGALFGENIVNLYGEHIETNANGLITKQHETSVSFPEKTAIDYMNTGFTLKGKNGDSRFTLGSLTMDDLRETTLYNRLYSETLLGSETGTKYDSKTRSYIQTNNLPKPEEPEKPKRAIIKETVDEVVEEAVPQRTLTEKMNAMRESNTAYTYLDETEDAAEVMRTHLDLRDIERMEYMSTDQIYTEFPAVKEYLEKNVKLSASEKQEIQAQVDKQLGVDATDYQKDQLKSQLQNEKKAEKRLKELKAFKDNARMYMVEQRDYLANSGVRKRDMEEDNAQAFKEREKELKVERDKEKYLNKLKESTHTLNENGEWVRNDKLPTRKTDKIRQYITMDMNPMGGNSDVTNKLLLAINKGQTNLGVAEENIVAETERLKEMRLNYNKLFEEHRDNEAMQETLASMSDEIDAQKANVSTLKSIISNKGYDPSLSETSFNKKTGKLESVGISKESYLQYIENPEKLMQDIQEMNNETLFQKERKRVENKESWYRAMDSETIVKGSFNDDRGYVVHNIDPQANIGYVSAPTLKVSDLYYKADITNDELLDNITQVEESALRRIDPLEQDLGIDTTLRVSDFEDISSQHITVYGAIPEVKLREKMELEHFMNISDAVIAYANRDVASTKKPSGYIPDWAVKELDSLKSEMRLERDAARLHADELMSKIEETKNAQAVQNSVVDVEITSAKLERLMAEHKEAREKASALKAQHAEVLDQTVLNVKQRIVDEYNSRAEATNDKIRKEMQLFGFTQEDGEGRFKISRKDFEEKILGSDERVSNFINKMIGGHFTHLTDTKNGDNALSSIYMAALETIDNHIDVQTEFDLRDTTLARNYMWSLDPNALSVSDLNQKNQASLQRYVDSLPEKGITQRLEDSLFSDIVQKGFKIEYGSGGREGATSENIIRTVMSTLSVEGVPDADITGLYIYNMLHEKDSQLNSHISKGYQSEVLKLSDRQIQGFINDLRAKSGSTSVDELSERGYQLREQELDSQFYKNDYYDDEAVYERYDDELGEKLGTTDTRYNLSDRAKKTKYDQLLEGIHVQGLDTSKLKDLGIKKVFSELSENDDTTDWGKVQTAYEEATKRHAVYMRRNNVEAAEEYHNRAVRIEMYARGTHAGQENVYRNLLRFRELNLIDSSKNLIDDVLDSDALTERQVATTLELANSLGKKVEVKIPLPDGSFTNGHLRFGENNEIEAYSPALKQAYVVNQSGKSKVATVDISKTGAFSVGNRMNSTQSYSKQQPILKQSIANEAQMKRNGIATVISNIDGSFGELVDFVESGKKGISYDLETTMTGARHLSNVIQPVEIFAQQLQFDRETGQLMKDADGRYVVEEEIRQMVDGADGESRLETTTQRTAREFHAVVALEDPAKEIINKIADSPDYFNIGTDRDKVHISNYIDALKNKEPGVSNVDFVKEIFDRNVSKKKARDIVKELSVKAEEFQFLNNVAKYAFGADKTEAQLEMFGKYSSSSAVYGMEDFKSELKRTNVDKYNTYFNKDGQLIEGMEVGFRRELYAKQNEQSQRLVADASQAARNLDNLDFNYGEGVRHLTAAEALTEFEKFKNSADATVMFGQNHEKADNKTVVDTARNVVNNAQKQMADLEASEKLTGTPEINGKPTLGSALAKLKDARQNIFISALGEITDEYKDKFGINPIAAEDHRRQLQEVIDDPNRSKLGYLNSKNKIWVSNLTEALQFIPEMNNSQAKVSFSSKRLRAIDSEIEELTSIFDKISSGSSNLTADELETTRKLKLFGDDDFALRKIIAPPADLVERMETMFDNVGIVDQQNISRVVFPMLKSQSNASLMAHLGEKGLLAHDGKFDTIFTSTNIDNFASQIFDIYNGNINSSNEALANVLLSIDSKEEGKTFMERNSYKGDGTEYISFANQPEEGVQKGVYRLDGFNESGTQATFSRMILGENGPVVDTSVKPYTMDALTNAELAHRFATSVRSIEDNGVVAELDDYNRDISRRHFEKMLNNNFSFDSHINQVRQLQIEGNINTGIFEGNPLFNIESEVKNNGILGSAQDELIPLSNQDGKVSLATNPLERARGIYKEKIMTRPKLKEIIESGEDAQDLTDIEKNLIRNSELLSDAGKEKFYNKNLSKEQVQALQDIDLFNSTELGGTISDLMDNVTALESQGVISNAEKASILSSWNEELKKKATDGKHVYNVKDAVAVPDFMLNIKNNVDGTTRSVPIQSTIQVSSPTEVANSLTSIAKTINKHQAYEADTDDLKGLREDRAINDELMKVLRKHDIVKEDQLLGADGKPRFVGLGELSHVIFDNVQKDPSIMAPVQAIDYVKMASEISDESLGALQTKAQELLQPALARQTDKQAVQMAGLIESKRQMREAGLYIPGMKLQPGNFDDSEVAELKNYMSSSFMKRLSTTDLVARADELAGSATDSAKEATKMIYKEIMNRTLPTDGSKRSIDPQEIIDSGDWQRIEAARAMNWITPVRDSNVLYKVQEDMAERRIGFGSMAGAKMKDLPVWMLNSQASHALEARNSPFERDQLDTMAYRQQQQQILDWKMDDYKGHDQRQNKYNTARGEAPVDNANIIREANEMSKEMYENERRNPTQSFDDGISELVEQRASRTEPSSILDGSAREAIEANANVKMQEPISEEDLLHRSKEVAEMVEPTKPDPSGLESFISRKKADLGDTVGELLQGGNGGKWVAGLGVAAAALFTVNAMNSPMKLETRPSGHGVKGVTGTPEDDTDRSNKQEENRQTLSEPKHQQGGRTYVTSGEKGYTIKARGTAPSNIDSSQLQSTINSSMTGTNGVNINLRDDRSSIDHSWLETQFSNFIERGSVGG